MSTTHRQPSEIHPNWAELQAEFEADRLEVEAEDAAEDADAIRRPGDWDADGNERPRPDGSRPPGAPRLRPSEIHANWAELQAEFEADRAEVEAELAVDPFALGWRDRPDKDPIPLTFEDLLHPRVGDFIVQNIAHINTCRHLSNVFRSRLADDPSAVVLTDVRVDFNIPNVRGLGPDVAVFLGATPTDDDYGTLDVAARDARPILVVEITSKATKKVDLAAKIDYYYRAGVPTYVIANVRRKRGRRVATIEPYRLGADGYELQPTDALGRYRLDAPLDLWLAPAENGCLVCHDGPTNVLIGDYVEVDRARRDAEVHAKAEAAARAEAQDRLLAEAAARAQVQGRLEAEAAARAEAQDRLLAEAAARAQVQGRFAEAQDRLLIEAAGRTSAEDRVRELEAELRRLRGGA